MNDTYKSKDNHQHLKKSMLRDAGARKSSRKRKDETIVSEISARSEFLEELRSEQSTIYDYCYELDSHLNS